jgi:hypothetical protein
LLPFFSSTFLKSKHKFIQADFWFQTRHPIAVDSILLQCNASGIGMQRIAAAAMLRIPLYIREVP